ncbi:MAG: PBP1A family penicillin-binding protein [Gemmatimonadales bacterium]
MDTVRRLWNAFWDSRAARRTTGLSMLAVMGLGAGVVWGSWSRACAGGNCPSIASLDGYRAREALKIYAADGRLITEIGTQRRTVVRLDELPPAVPAAFLAVEDQRFYEHGGVDFRGVFRAVVKNALTLSFEEGFSTISMQLARNVFPERLPSTKTIVRKVREVRVALELERTFPKERILELYLNQVFMGGSLYGVEAAAQGFFGKSARDVNVAEAALLAGVLRYPNFYDPRRNPNNALRRRNLVLNLMRDQGYLTHEEAEQWKAWPIELSQRGDFGEIAPYFVEWVRQQVYDRFGSAIFERGYRVYTTLDLDMQVAAERSLEDQLVVIESEAYGPFAHATYLEAMQQAAETGQVVPYLQGALVSLDARTGHVRAMVGGRDFQDSKFNRAVQAERQAGSTFKPFVYSAALRTGLFTTSTIIDDAPISLTLEGDSLPWEPQNYEGDFRGPMTLRRGLALSRNLVAIRLGEQIGVPAVRGEALRFGLSTPIPIYPAIHIGSASVRPIEMASAYTAFATLGERAAPIGIVRVEDETGAIVWEPQIRRDRVMEVNHAWLMTDLLKSVVNNGSAYRAVRETGRFFHPAGGKTGTTNDGTDVWFVGFTSEIVTAVWMGFDQPVKIKANAAGGVLAAPAWTSFMNAVYERRLAPSDWQRPADLVGARIDNITGRLATPYCPSQNTDQEWYLPGTQPRDPCPLHWFRPGFTYRETGEGRRWVMMPGETRAAIAETRVARSRQ